MATVADLLGRLHYQTHSLARTPEDTVTNHVAGWMLLARATQHAIIALPLGGRGDVVKAGVRNVLQPLAHGPRELLVDVEPASQLAALAQTMGGISDILVDNLSAGGRVEQAGTEALKLEASLLAAVHVAARWSRSTMNNQKLPTTRVSIMAFLDDLAVVTEPYALIPLGRRSSILEDFALRAPNSSGVEGAAVAWANVAATTLGESYRVSGWAMQAIAANLALLSHTARQALLVAAERGNLAPGIAAGASERLATSAECWRAAATWPPHLRLGGQTNELRDMSRDLRESITNEPPSGVGEWRRVLSVAMPIALGHAAVMRKLVHNHELWIHGWCVDPVFGYVRRWEREPPWSEEGGPLMKAAQAGYEALDGAVTVLGGSANGSTSTAGRARWAPATAAGIQLPTTEPATGASVRDRRQSPQI